MLKLKKEDSYTSTPYLSFRGLLEGEPYLIYTSMYIYIYTLIKLTASYKLSILHIHISELYVCDDTGYFIV